MAARWAVFISGRGSNLASLLERSDEIEIALVVSSKPGASGLAKARRAGVATDVLAKKINWDDVQSKLLENRISHICLAGFMKLVPATFVANWKGRLINLHPSLLPKYPGLESITAAYNAGDEVGVTVHEVDEGVDTGKIILQQRCMKRTETQATSLAAVEFAVHVTEQRLLSRVVRAFSRSKGFA